MGRDVVVVVLGVQSVVLVVVRPISYLLVAFDPEKLHAPTVEAAQPVVVPATATRGPNHDDNPSHGDRLQRLDSASLSL